MYITLRSIYDYNKNNIYVLNLDGSELNNYKEHFDPYDDDLPNYKKASIDSFVSTLKALNSTMSQNNSNQLLFYISGHQGSGVDPNGYHDGRLLDEEFADSVDTHLLANGVDSNTRFIYVIGSCSGYGFWNDLSADADTISFAAADTAIGFNTITAGPKFSFMYYWRETSHNIINASIHDIFNVAKDSLYQHYGWDDERSTPQDVPKKHALPSGWDTDWTLWGARSVPAALNIGITGPDMLEYKEKGTWAASGNWGDYSVIYQWWKKYDGSSSWTTLGSDSTQSVLMLRTGFTLKLRVTRGWEYDEATHYVQYGYCKGSPLGKVHVNLISENRTPDNFSLYANYPNPFNPGTTIRFDIPAIKQASIEVQIQVYNLMGQRVATPFKGDLASGAYEIRWNAINDQGVPLPSGVYIYTIQSNLFHASKKMIIIK